MNYAAVAATIACDGQSAALQAELLTGLTARQKYLPAKYLYDERGSQLFDQICELPEYYVTRTEVGILRDCADEIAQLVGPDCVLIELGGGASRKVRLLLDALRPRRYIGVDIAREFLQQALQRLAQDYTWLTVNPVYADFTQEFHLPPMPAATRLIFFPGSTIGNFEPPAAVQFLRRLRAQLDAGDGLLIGVDLKKDPQILRRAYNDAAGVTADFNLNLLHRLRNELQADIDPARFRHRAFYNSHLGRIEMHLVSDCEQFVNVQGRRIHFAMDESIHTESSYKYAIDEFHALAREAGYAAVKTWTDQQQLFSVHYLACVHG